MHELFTTAMHELFTTAIHELFTTAIHEYFEPKPLMISYLVCALLSSRLCKMPNCCTHDYKIPNLGLLPAWAAAFLPVGEARARPSYTSVARGRGLLRTSYSLKFSHNILCSPNDTLAFLHCATIWVLTEKRPALYCFKL